MGCGRNDGRKSERGSDHCVAVPAHETAKRLPEDEMKPLVAALAIIGVLLGACSDAPTGRWQVIAPVDVYADNDDVAPVVFQLQPGDFCALGDAWSYQKVYRFKRVSCAKGEGWVSTDSQFVQSPELPPEV